MDLLELPKGHRPRTAGGLSDEAYVPHRLGGRAASPGLLDSKVKIDGIYDLSILNKLLTAAGQPTVKD
jgi:hypothetical protein